jgi:hypothetical protein
MAPQTRNWKANEMPDFAGGGYYLTVTGDVEVSATNKTPHLSSHSPQGFNPRILLLDLTISESGFGADVMTWKRVAYRARTNGNQYDQTDILFDGDRVASVKVDHPKTAAPAKKKAAAKKKTAKKAVKKAKKAVKKSVKKKTKKKAAKKTRKKKRI